MGHVPPRRLQRRRRSGRRSITSIGAAGRGVHREAARAREHVEHPAARGPGARRGRGCRAGRGSGRSSGPRTTSASNVRPSSRNSTGSVGSVPVSATPSNAGAARCAPTRPSRSTIRSGPRQRPRASDDRADVREPRRGVGLDDERRRRSGRRRARGTRRSRRARRGSRSCGPTRRAWRGDRSTRRRGPYHQSASIVAGSPWCSTRTRIGDVGSYSPMAANRRRSSNTTARSPGAPSWPTDVTARSNTHGWPPRTWRSASR